MVFMLMFFVCWGSWCDGHVSRYDDADSDDDDVDDGGDDKIMIMPMMTITIIMAMVTEDIGFNKKRKHGIAKIEM